MIRHFYSQILVNQYNYIYEAIKKIPFGKIITFRKLAYKLGNGITPNVINTAFRLCPNPQEINLHRVICSDGTISQGYPFGGATTQIQKLEA